MMESEAGNAAALEGRKESWGAILRDRFVRATVLWPRDEVIESVVEGLSSLAAGRARVWNSIVIDCLKRPGMGHASVMAAGVDKVCSGGKGRY